MSWKIDLKRISKPMRKLFHPFCLSIGVVVMMISNANAAKNFKLKPAKFYFEDQKVLALLNYALAGNLAEAQKLVADGANPNTEGPMNNPYNRLRPLHFAIAARNPQAVKVLIAVGADPELDTTGGAGPAFLFAANLNDIEVLSLMLDLRPVQSLSRRTLRDLLFESVIMSHPRCIELLLKRGAPIDFPDEAGHTIMMRAMDAQDYDLAEALILQGASVHVETKGGLRPAYAVQFHLQKFKPGSPTQKKVQRLKELMEARGAKFPAPSPEEVRAKRDKQ